MPISTFENLKACQKISLRIKQLSNLLEQKLSSQSEDSINNMSLFYDAIKSAELNLDASLFFFSYRSIEDDGRE